jgi:hypothetical protein
MKRIGIDPITLFKDTDSTLSLAHELVALKTKTVRYISGDGRRRIGTVADKYKNNELLKILFDAHTSNEFTETDKLIEILDFIKVHVSFTSDKRDANVYINAWRELYDDPITKSFAVKLMFYSILTSNDTGGNNLFKYVPVDMLHEYGLFDAERMMIDMLGDPFMYFASADEAAEQHMYDVIRPIVENVESILVDDFDFSETYSLQKIVSYTDRITGQSSYVNRKEYIGFGNVFNNVVSIGEEDQDVKIPYVFIPARLSENNNIVYSSKTMSKNGKPVN